MTKRMLIDASHPEQTRVGVIDGNRIEDLDFESAARRQLKGNIYLAKVTRIEPSLQAAFVEYGGNRHGFLSFAEIHPDYYRLPVADREKLDALLAEAMTPKSRDADHIDQPRVQTVAADPAALPDFDDHLPLPVLDPTAIDLANPTGLGAFETEGPAFSVRDWLGNPTGPAAASAPPATTPPAAAALVPPLADELALIHGGGDETESTDIAALPLLADRPLVRSEQALAEIPEADALLAPLEVEQDVLGPAVGEDDLADDEDEDLDEDDEDGAAADESVLRRLRQRFLRHYKIQEVVKRRQVMLVQVVKEERGNKGAALTTYLSLPGRYCVLMPNSPRGGGVSRKVTNPGERRRLKHILDQLDIPQGMSVILRTAGIERTEAEIKRDFEYLMRLWDTIREMTLKSTAPALIYEEGNLIKRAIRDLYDSSIHEILVAGEGGYQNAYNFMQMLMPGHVNKVVHYKNASVPLFFRYQVETQIEALDSPVVQLRSGGYLVINPTEALVSIDVNSGRSTRERDIEETALRTNIEAAEEVARQVRLRDLAGLIVIDFIDMEDGRNNAAVERRMKEAMRNDRARLQIGRISPFGLMELSRQRLRPSLLETNCEKCQHCGGTGYVKTSDTAALSVLRAIEEEGIRNRASEIVVHLPTVIAQHILNYKRSTLAEIEQRHNFQVLMRADDATPGQAFRIERVRARIAVPGAGGLTPVNGDQAFTEGETATESLPPTGGDFGLNDDAPQAPSDQSREGRTFDNEGGRDGRGRRRRRRGGRDRGERNGGERSGGDRENRGDNGWRNSSNNNVQQQALPVEMQAMAPQGEGVAAEGNGDGTSPGAREDNREERGGRFRRRRGRRGGRNRGERDGVQRDGVQRDGAPRDGAQRESAPREGGPREGGQQRDGNREIKAHDAPDGPQPADNRNADPVLPDSGRQGRPWRNEQRPPRSNNGGGGNHHRAGGPPPQKSEPASFNGSSGFEIDTTPSAESKNSEPRSGEVVNQAPDKPRTGWWRRLTGV